MRTDIKTELAGKWSSVLQSIGFDESIFKGTHQPCVYCGGKDRARWVKNKEYYLCNQCGHHQPIDMAIDHLGMPYKETVNYIRPNMGRYKMTTTTSTNDTAKNEARLKKINSELKVFAPDCVALKYFASRGITKLPETDCHFHPGLDYWEDGQNMGKFPAIVSKFRTLTGETSTFHITYLNHDGTKLDVSAPKKILPTIRPLSGSAIRLFPATDVLCIAEGIESALSVHILTGLPVWAAGNAGNMAAMDIPDSVKKIYIYADEDENYCGQQAAYTLANRLQVKGDRQFVIVVRLFDRDEFNDNGDQYDFNDYLIAQNNV
ncbi:MAG: toprim domain-containing protein [Methylobacter sp.]